MSRWLRDPVTPPVALGLASDGCAFWVESQRQLHTRPWPADWRHLDARQVTSTLTELAGEAAIGDARTVRLLLAEELNRYWMVQPPASTRSLNELRAVAKGRGDQIFGGLAGRSGALDGWRVQGDWSATHEFLCAATPEALLQGVERWQKAGRYALMGRLSTALLEQLDVHRAQLDHEGWACVTWPERTHLLMLRQGRLAGLRTMPAGQDEPVQRRLHLAMEELRRERMRLAVRNDLPIFWLDRGTGTDDTSDQRVIEIGGEAMRLERKAPLRSLADMSSSTVLAGRYAWLAEACGGRR